MSRRTNCLSRAEADALQEAFELFDTEHRGRVDPNVMKTSLQELGFDQTNPVVYDIIASMATKDNSKGITFYDFIENINDRLSAQNSPSDYKQIYDTYADSNGLITKESLNLMCDKLEKDYDDPELNEALSKVRQYASTMTFDEFCNLMEGRL